VPDASYFDHVPKNDDKELLNVNTPYIIIGITKKDQRTAVLINVSSLGFDSRNAMRIVAKIIGMEINGIKSSISMYLRLLGFSMVRSMFWKCKLCERAEYEYW
jgi:hypothetical protein